MSSSETRRRSCFRCGKAKNKLEAISGQRGVSERLRLFGIRVIHDDNNLSARNLQSPKLINVQGCSVERFDDIRVARARCFKDHARLAHHVGAGQRDHAHLRILNPTPKGCHQLVTPNERSMRILARAHTHPSFRPTFGTRRLQRMRIADAQIG